MEKISKEQKVSTNNLFNRLKVPLVILIVIGEGMNTRYFLYKPNPLLDTLLNVLVSSYLLILGIQNFKNARGKFYIFAIIAMLIFLTNILILFAE